MKCIAPKLSPISVRVKRLHPEAQLPVYGTDGAGAFDIYSAPDTQRINVASCNPVAVKTGLAFAIPKGYVMLVFSRSGTGFKNDTRLANCVGVIDSDYRGELMVKLTRDPAQSGLLSVGPNERIAQGIVVPFPRVEFEVEEELDETERGEGGFGSTGTK